MPNKKIKLSHRIQYALAWPLLALLGRLPLALAASLGAVIGALAAPLPLRSNATARANLRLAFPDWSERQIRRTQFLAMVNLGRTVTEFPAVHHLSRRAFDRHVTLTGLHHLTDHPDALLLTAHLGNWELILRACAVYDMPAAHIYRAANNPLMDDFIVRLRAQPGAVAIPKGRAGGRMLVKEVKDGRHVGFLNDQKLNDGIPAPFFGQDVMTAPALAELALKYHRPICPVFCYRTGWATFAIQVGAPLPLPQGGATADKVATATALFNQTIEDAIRHAPEQWLWAHKRF